MVGPDFALPSANVEAAWSEQGGSLYGGRSAQVDRSWWRQFNDRELNRLVGLARGQNLSLQIAALRILESRAVLGVVEGNLFPQSQSVGADFFRIGTGGSAPNLYFNTSSVAFDAAWELDFWGKFRRSIESADAGLLVDVADYDDILVSLTAEVASIYINIRTLEERIRLAQQNAELQTNSLDIVQKQLDAGTVTKLDLLQAEGLLLTTQAQIPNLQGALQQLHNAMAVLLGLAPDGSKAIVRSGGGIPTISKQLAIGMPCELLRRRPDIRRSEMAAAAQSSQIGIAKADLYPSFTLVGSLGFSADDIAPNQLSGIFDGQNFGYSVGPSVRWNILNYGRIKNGVRAEDAQFQQSIVSYENSVLNAAREVEDAIAGYTYSKKESEFLRRGVETAKESSRLSQLQYTEGLADYQRVLDSIRSLTQKEDQYAAVQGDIAVSLVAMYKALGGGWENHDRDSSIPQHTKEEMKERTNWGKMLDDPQEDEAISGEPES